MDRPGPALVIFTDLDGTFLDHNTYRCDPALPAYRRCRECGVPVVFCSSKTRAEIEQLHRTLASADPFIVENGGAVYVPAGHFPFALHETSEKDGYLLLELGIPYGELAAALDRCSRETGVAIEAFHAMTVERIAGATGLPLQEAALAAQREYDEPFTVAGVPPGGAALFAALESAGLRWTRGSRFCHVFGHRGKGVAVEALSHWYRRWNPAVVTAGLGDSPNDIPLLEAVDAAILVQRPSGAYDSETRANVPGVQCASGPGPEGWNLAVQELLNKRM